tara:strand:+ start:1180 stop:1368 length:189 start_codon:yes stop_codon:yes gene_type:complete
LTKAPFRISGFKCSVSLNFAAEIHPAIKVGQALPQLAGRRIELLFKKLAAGGKSQMVGFDIN